MPKVTDSVAVTEILEWGRYRAPLTYYYLHDDAANFHKVNQWRTTMTRRSYTIELKIDIPDNDERVDALKNLVARFAHDLLASAQLFSGADGKQPQVAMMTEDSFMDTEEVRFAYDYDKGEVVVQGDKPIDDPSIDDQIRQEAEDIAAGRKPPIEV